jgi:hypothetical protein
MANLGIDTPPALDAAIASNSLASHNALWREARGTGVHKSDVILSLVALLAVASLFLGRNYSAVVAVSACLAVISGFAVRASRQHNALCALVERLEATALKAL